MEDLLREISLLELTVQHESSIRDLTVTIQPTVTVSSSQFHETQAMVQNAERELIEVEGSIQRYVEAIKAAQLESNSLAEELTTLEVYCLDRKRREDVIAKVTDVEGTSSLRGLGHGKNSKKITKPLASESVSLRGECDPRAKGNLPNVKLETQQQHTTAILGGIPSFMKDEMEDPAVLTIAMRSLTSDIAGEPQRLTAEELTMRRHREYLHHMLETSTEQASEGLNKYCELLCKYRHITQPKLDTLSTTLTKLDMKSQGLQQAILSASTRGSVEIESAVQHRRKENERKLEPLRQEAAALDERIFTLRDQEHALRVAKSEKIRNLRNEMKTTKRAVSVLK
eukprot:PhF_6_TR27020/c0_g1_i2/m.39464